MPPKVIRKVRTPEGQKRYGQPIGTIITKDMQAAAAFRFMYTPFTVQYYLGVLSYNQLVKQGKKYSPPLPGKPVGTKEHPSKGIPADHREGGAGRAVGVRARPRREGVPLGSDA